MDAASVMTVSVTPPSFQKAAEEARHDAKLREPIPEAKASGESAKNGQIGDQRGNTDGQNSNLQNETATLIANKAAVRRGQKRFNRKRRNREEREREREAIELAGGVHDEEEAVHEESGEENADKEGEESGADTGTGSALTATLNAMTSNFQANLRSLNTHGLESFLGKRGLKAATDEPEDEEEAASGLDDNDNGFKIDLEPFEPGKYTPRKKLTYYEKQNIDSIYSKGKTNEAGIIAKRYGGSAFNTIVGYYFHVTI